MENTNEQKSPDICGSAASAGSAIPLTVHIVIAAGSRSRELRLGRSVAAELAEALIQMLADTSPDQCGVYRIEV